MTPIRSPTRRELLYAGVVGAFASVAGCLGTTDSPGAGTPSRTPSPPTTDPGDAEASLEVTDRSCGEGANRAAIRVEGNSISIEGTIAGSDTCDTAAFDEVSWERGTLTVAVAAVRETEGTPACAQCITDIDYLATVSTAGRDPDRVVVVHESLGERTTVTTLDR